MLVIGFTGPKRSGKDTALRIIQAEYGYHNVATYAFAKPLYDMLELLLQPEGLPALSSGEVDKAAVIKPYNVTLRHMLQTLGTEWGRDCIDPDMWALRGECMLKDVRQFQPDNPIFVFSDVRFDNEAEMIKANGGYIIQIDRSVPKSRNFRERLQQVFGSNEDRHASESGISEDLIDKKVYNHGTLIQFELEVLRTVAKYMRKQVKP